MKFIATDKAILQLKSDFLKLCSEENITQSIEEIVHAEVYSNVQSFIVFFIISQEFNATTQPALNVALNGFYDSCKQKTSTGSYKFKHFKQGNQYHGMISSTF